MVNAVRRHSPQAKRENRPKRIPNGVPRCELPRSLARSRSAVGTPAFTERGSSWPFRCRERNWIPRPSRRGSLVVYDELGAGVGDQIMLSEGAEAAQPFYPELVPIDAYNAGILDQLDIRE